MVYDREEMPTIMNWVLETFGRSETQILFFTDCATDKVKYWINVVVLLTTTKTFAVFNSDKWSGD